MKIIVALFVLLFTGRLIASAQRIPTPANYTIVDSVVGDLDGDKIEEMVVVYTMHPQPEDNFESIRRELVIYRKSAGQWKVWKSSRQALLGSRDGGMMGDPYVGMEISKGVLKIDQGGGSSWKWDHTDKYRFQKGDFYLIGYESHYGKLCEYWMNTDFNLMTGKLAVTKEYESCENDDQKIYKRENETMYKKGLRITIGKRNEKDIVFTTPKYAHDVYISSLQEE